jgi:amidase
LGDSLLDEAGMPFGLQIVRPRGGDAIVLGVAAALESACADDAILRRPAPDLARLSQAPPLSRRRTFATGIDGKWEIVDVVCVKT